MENYSCTVLEPYRLFLIGEQPFYRTVTVQGVTTKIIDLFASVGWILASTVLPWTGNKNSPRKCWITFGVLACLWRAWNMLQGTPPRCSGAIAGVREARSTDNGDFSRGWVSKKRGQLASRKYDTTNLSLWYLWCERCPPLSSATGMRSCFGARHHHTNYCLHGMGMSQAAIQQKLNRKPVAVEPCTTGRSLTLPSTKIRADWAHCS